MGLGAAAELLGFNAKRASKVVLGIASALLRDGEQVEALVAGQLLDQTALAVLTGTRVLVVNDREWRPDVEVIPLEAGLTVQGWQDDRTASLTFVLGSRQVVVDHIADRDSAVAMATAIRAKVGG
jgi:hypothetical protein